jgi:NADH-quinone oxidoreductase subunit H
MFKIFIKILFIIIPVLVAVAYFTLVERKLLAAIQRRRGPDVVGVVGLLQPLADGLKLFTKEVVLPTSSDVVLFIVAPILTFFISLITWVVIPFGNGSFFGEMSLGVLYLFAISSLGVYGIILGGWSGRSAYAFFGSLRSAAQILSYELTIGFIILTVGACSGSLNLIEIVLSQKHIWYCIPLWPLFIVFCISMLAETNRHPFDLPEAESELVSGYNVEHSAMAFALFFLGEYSNMLLMSSLATILFLGGWLSPLPFLNFLPASFWFSLKVLCFTVFFILARAIIPRYRYDQLMSLGWKSLLPITLSWFFLTVSILISFNWIS